MSEELIEAIARAMYERDCIGLTKWSLLPSHKRHPWEANARAALAAIEASGHAVVPVTPTQEMEDAIWFQVSCRHPDQGALPKDATDSVYPAMLAARPKVTP